MITPAGIFEIETTGRTVIVTPRTDLDELEYQEIEAGAAEILSLLQQPVVSGHRCHVRISRHFLKRTP